MDKLIFNHPGGFPLETQTLQAMQEAWNNLALFAKGFGDNVFLSGCELMPLNPGSIEPFNLSPGVIIINGEIVEFQGGLFQSVNSRIKVYEQDETVVLKSGESVVFRKKRIAKASNNNYEGVPVANFQTLKNLREVTIALMGKVDKVDGFGLSENNYTDGDKELVGQISNKVTKSSGMGLSHNDFTNIHKEVLETCTPKLYITVNENFQITSSRGIIEVEQMDSDLSNGIFAIQSIAVGNIPDTAVAIISNPHHYNVLVGGGHVLVQRTPDYSNNIPFGLILFW